MTQFSPCVISANSGSRSISAWLSVCPSVHLSGTFWYYFNNSRPMIMMLLPHGSPFQHTKKVVRKFDRSSTQLGAKQGSGGKVWIHSHIGLLLRNGSWAEHSYGLSVVILCCGLDWIEQCFTSPPTQYRLYRRRFFRSKDPTISNKVLKAQIVQRQIKHTISRHEHKTQQVP